MDNRSAVNSLFQSIASQLGFQVTLGENNLCNIKRKSTGEETIIELPNNDETLYIYAVIGDVPFANREKFFEYVLKLNLHGNGTGKGIIGIDMQTNKFILSRPFPIKSLDDGLLLQSIGEFFSTVSQLKEKLVHFNQIQTSKNSVAIPDGQPLTPNLNFII
ncbi:MAG: CesT family type III secretion system chaperone [Puniceicoccales bacterium]|jgi:hypothetical protein|nr:CesT family type III secretion system chaperone [Puniceicoccales bacterium]